MYATLPLKRLVSVLVWPFGLVLVGLVAWKGFPTTAAMWMKTIGQALSYWALALLLLAGSANRFSPWRLVWRACPPLNRWLFPDLNGVWRGHTASNWPVVKSMFDAATGGGAQEATSFEAIPLQEDEIVITIKASLFFFRLTATLPSTGGKSHSVTAIVSKDTQRDIFQLQYVFSQDTPEAGLMDDSSHLGAATAELDLEQWELSGYYWTRRKWRSGLSTAGKLKVRRVSR